MSSAAAESSVILYSMIDRLLLQTDLLPASSQCRLAAAVPTIRRNMTVRNGTAAFGCCGWSLLLTCFNHKRFARCRHSPAGLPAELRSKQRLEHNTNGRDAHDRPAPESDARPKARLKHGERP